MSVSAARRILVVLAAMLQGPGAFAQSPLEEDLRSVLGHFPAPPPLRMKIVETVQVEGGTRQKIEYSVEDPDTLFDRPADKVQAYLFVPDRSEGDKFPAVIAIHQDEPSTHLGKAEPAGLAGADDQHYGLELFNRGYVVICPDRYYHAERRRIPSAAEAPSHQMRDLASWLKWAGQLILSGRTHFGKEVYDLMRATDVLTSLDFVDRDRIGAVGHSAGGNVLVYFMFMDNRIKAGASSCGFYELLHDFNDRDRSFSNSVFAIPGLARIGRSADYLASIAPRPFLMTRGMSELSTEEQSRQHVDQTREIARYAQKGYEELSAADKFRVIYFDGGHEFPKEIRTEVYEWLDSYLKE